MDTSPKYVVQFKTDKMVKWEDDREFDETDKAVEWCHSEAEFYVNHNWRVVSRVEQIITESTVVGERAETAVTWQKRTKRERNVSYVNVGVNLNLSDITTKKALIEAVRENPEKVLVYSTSAFDRQFSLPANKLDKADKYTVAGPNPYNNRKWYATIEFSSKADKWVVK